MTSQTDARWIVSPRDKDFEIEVARSLGIHSLAAAVLRNRGICEPRAIQEFLEPSLDRLHDPFDLPDMAPAVERTIAALQAAEPILVHGDYDVDGITATALLCRFLEKLGADVRYFIPHRTRDSYGLSAEALAQAASEGLRLVIAVDCGVTAHEAIEAARKLGADTIVLDHHEPGSTLPEAVAIVDPKRDDSAYPERNLASVGLAFKFASAICQRQGIEQAGLRRAYLDLVALGTIADVVPLTGENRILTRFGLGLLPRTRKLGLRALLRICNLDSKLRASDIAFRLAPRMNAAGRMGDATDALELLLTADEQEAQRLALHLDSINRERQHEQDAVFREAMARVESEIDLGHEPVIVLSSDRWHVGVLGIVAAKLLERYGRPAVLMAQDGDTISGSARSIAGFDINAAFEQCSDVLTRYGGHARAAGLALQADKLDAFRERINLVAQQWLTPEDLTPVVSADAEVRLFEIDAELIENLQRMEPCGHGNRQAEFISSSVEVLDCRCVGRDEQHLKLYVCQDDRPLECIGFGMGPQAEWVQQSRELDICYLPELNDYNGRVGLQLRLEAIRPAQTAG